MYGFKDLILKKRLFVSLSGRDTKMVMLLSEVKKKVKAAVRQFFLFLSISVCNQQLQSFVELST